VGRKVGWGDEGQENRRQELQKCKEEDYETKVTFKTEEKWGASSRFAEESVSE